MHDRLMSLLEGSVTPFGGFGIALALAFVLILRLLVPRARRSTVRAPVVLLVLHLALVLIVGLLPDGESDSEFGDLGLQALRLAALTVLLLSIARSFYLLLLYTFLERPKSLKRSWPGIFRDIVQVAIYSLVALFVLHQAGVEPGSLLTTSALLTAVIGLSLQDTLGNLFAGLAIQLQTPFEVGDWIQFDDEESRIGEVLEINWRATRLLSIDRIEIIVPNNLLARAPIRNFSKPTRLVRRSATVIAPYDAPPARVHRMLTEAVVEVDGVRTNPPPDVQTVDFTERGVEYRVRFFIEDFELREVIDSRVRDRFWYALRRGALPIPPPQRRVTLIEQSVAATEQEHLAMVRDVERALHRVPLLNPLHGDLLHEVALHADRRLYAPGELVIQQGDYGSELFICEKGTVEVLVDAHEGMELVATLKAGDFFGEMGLMTGETRKATVRVVDEVTLLVVSKDSLQPILEASPDLAREISEVLAHREAQLVARSRGTPVPRDEVTERSGELLTRIRDFFSI